jgi:epidermal growth factor receptor substrate 15
MASFTPTLAEVALVTQIFLKADPQKKGILTGDAALEVFGPQRAKLPLTILAAIWSIVDGSGNGLLSRKEIAIAVRLMGWAQKGEKVTMALIDKRECDAICCC